MKNRIKELRLLKGLTQHELAEAVGTTQPTINRLENVKRGLDVDWMTRIARALGCEPADLIAREQEVAVAGFVGAGQTVIPFNDYPLGEGVASVTVPAGLGRVVAVVVKGDSMLPRYEDGDVILYGEKESPQFLFGRECVVTLSDGRKYLKKLAPGSADGLYNLESHNATTMRDEEVVEASAVRWVERAPVSESS